PDVEKIYNDIKALASQKVQITNAQLNRDSSGRISATMSMLIAPEESEAVIGRTKGFGRVENFQTQTERIAQGGSGMSENAKTKWRRSVCSARNAQARKLMRPTRRRTSRSRFTARGTLSRTRAVRSPHSAALSRKAPAPSCGACGW